MKEFELLTEEEELALEKMNIEVRIREINETKIPLEIEKIKEKIENMTKLLMEGRNVREFIKITEVKSEELYYSFESICS